MRCWQEALQGVIAGKGLIAARRCDAGECPHAERRTAGTAGWGHNNRTTTQYGLTMKGVPSSQPVTVVLYPVLGEQVTPRFKSLGDGRVVKIESQFGTDYAMLALERFQFDGEGLAFDGKAGAVRTSGNC